MPRAIPRWSSGKASVRMAEEFAISIAAPSAWNSRMVISHIPAAWPCIHVTERTSEKKVKTAKPRL